MKKLPFFLLLILLLKTTISVDSIMDPALLKYVLQWPPTFCYNLNSEEKRWCKQPIRDNQFTLHGLMPADKEGFDITRCYPGYPDWDKVFQPIHDELVTFWPSLREDFNETELWKQQWLKHGACVRTSPEKYFRTAIEINVRPVYGNLFYYLDKSGISPSDTQAYTKQEIYEAVQKLVNESKLLIPPRHIYLSCIPIHPDNTTHVYLSEVTLCTNTNGTEYISCPLEADPSSCPDKALVMLPLPQPQRVKTPMERIANNWYHGLNKIFNG